MPIAYGQNMTELGRNIIDLEQLKNARDAQQVNAQNAFLAQLNQAALGRQQLAAQSQQSNNALMMQSLQQQMQQRNQDRDFGLRQTAQGNQASQFEKALEVDKLRYSQPISAIAKLQFEDQLAGQQQDQIAKSISSEANLLLEKEDQDYVKALVENNKHGAHSGWNANKKRDDAKKALADAHQLKVDSILAPYRHRDFVGLYRTKSTRFKPDWTPGVDNPDIIRLEPVLRGRGGQGDPESPFNPLPGGASPRVVPDIGTGENNPLPPAAIPVASPRPASTTTSGWNFDQASWFRPAPQLPTPETIDDWIPMVDANGVIKRVHKSKVADWLQTQQWQALNSGTNSLPLPNFR